MSGTAAAYRVGIDVGSTSVKVVVTSGPVLDPIWTDYQRHESRPAERLLSMLQRAERQVHLAPANAAAFATGSGAGVIGPHIGARVVQEVAAMALAAQRRYPGARSLMELGGQDAKMVCFEDHAGRTRTFVSMNDKCAGGTGAVIDKIAAKLGIRPDERRSLGYLGRTIHPVAGKCGVFAETDINGLQKRGVPPDALMASLFDAIVLQNVAVLTRGRTLAAPVLLLGGPHAFLPGLCEAWRVHLARLWRERGVEVPPDGLSSLVLAPPLAEFYPALGAIALGMQDDTSWPAYLGTDVLAASLECHAHAARRRGVPAVGVTGLDIARFRNEYSPPAWTPPTLTAGQTVPGFIGLDAGSTSTKAVVLSPAGEVLAKAYALSRGNPIEDAIDMFRALRASVEAQGAWLDVRGLVTTGYAKDTLREVFCADAALVETVAHARSAMQEYRDPHVIVDVGGQDIKLIVLRNGRVKDFRLNTQCSAGNGYFLQAIAQTFGYRVEEFAEAALGAREMPEFGYGCVLFLQAEIADVQRHGWRPEEVLAGLAAVLPRNVFLYVAKAPNLARLGWRFVLQGGTQRNLAVVKAEVDFIRASFRGQTREPEIVLHRHAGEAGAIGAALEAIRLHGEGRSTSFIGLAAAERVRYRAHSGDDTRCAFCKNACLRTFIDVWTSDGVGGGEAPAGSASEPDRRLVIASCEKGSAATLESMRRIKAVSDAARARTPNLVALAARDAFASPHAPRVRPTGAHLAWSAFGRAHRARARERVSTRVGIPRVFNMFAFAPLFTGYLESLGLSPSNIVFSEYTTPELYRAGASRGAIDPCFPSKVALAHVHQLLYVVHGRRPLTCIFFPMIDVLPNRLGAGLGSDACPTVALTPQTVRAAFTKEGDLFAQQGVRFMAPLLNLRDRPLFRRQMFEAWGDFLGLSRDENDRAVDAGFAALDAHEQRVMAAARRALDDLGREGRVGVVLLGRVYHHDPGLNHGIAEDLQRLGYPVFSQSTLPLDADLLDRLFGEEVRAGLVGSARDVSDVWRNAYSGSSNLKLWAAKFTARHPYLAAVELSNFKCGHDAPIYSTIEDITERAGTPYFAFKDLDENRSPGALKLRLETIDYALQRHAEQLRERQARAARIERVLARFERLTRKRLAGVPTG